jgi:transcriptional repressor NrdR
MAGGPAGAAGTVEGMRCPGCASLDDKVVDSRLADEGVAIRRRRECLGCGRRFTTFERIDEVGLTVLKRSGQREPFRRGKVVAGVAAAAKNRPLGVEQLESLAADVEESLRLEGSEVTSARVGAIVLERLRALDEVAYVRFASVYKGFDDPGDFEREVLSLSRVDEPPPSAD